VVSADVKRAIRRFAAEFPPARWAVRAVARLIAPRHSVGAVGVVFDAQGRVLILEHAFRTDFPWGLPGGWVERGEEPHHAVKRELQEELGLDVEVRDVVACGAIGRIRTSTHPVHLGLAFYCRLRSGAGALSTEVLAFEWIDPQQPTHALEPFQHEAIILASRLHVVEGHGTQADDYVSRR
jgi:ADP-ribose pyrophosphatase YjhB (NUDIX family)